MSKFNKAYTFKGDIQSFSKFFKDKLLKEDIEITWNKKRVWLDDERPAPPNWIRTISPSETIDLLKKRDVDVVSLDHDLGDDENIGTGYDVLLWIEEQVFTDPSYIPPKMIVHSANPSASGKMQLAVDRINKEVLQRESGNNEAIHEAKTTRSDSELVKIAKEVGMRLYGKDKSGLIFSPTIHRLSWSEMLHDKDQFGDYPEEIDTFQYIFFPSNKKGLDAADTPYAKKHVDVDGNIYTGGASGIYVISDPFKKTKVQPRSRKIDPKDLDEWKAAVSEKHGKRHKLHFRALGHDYPGSMVAYYIKPNDEKEYVGNFDYDGEEGKYIGRLY